MQIPQLKSLKHFFLIPKEIYLGFVKIKKATRVFASIKYWNKKPVIRTLRFKY